MGKKHLIDTNVVLDFLGDNLPKGGKDIVSLFIDEGIILSAINKIELLGFSKVESILKEFVDCSKILPIDELVIEKAIELRRIYKTKLPDTIIAATAIVNDLVLVSRNIKDFVHIKGLDLLNPWDQ